MPQATPERAVGTEGGQAIVEFAFAFPLQLLVMFAIMQVALIYVAKMVITYSAFAAARAAMSADSYDEAERNARRAGALVCSPITGPSIAGSSFSMGDLNRDRVVLPGWGVVPKSGISYGLKTCVHPPDFSQPGEVRVTVCHYFELVFPVVSRLFAWMGDSGRPEGFLNDRTQFGDAFGARGTRAADPEGEFESNTGIWNIRRADHIRLRATAVLAIPGAEAQRAP